MLRYLFAVETELTKQIGRGSTFSNIVATNLGIGYEAGEFTGSYMMPGQCQAFLVSGESFIWFVEKWDLVETVGNDTPPLTLQNKKIYPAKVQGLSLAMLSESGQQEAITMRWRDGLIRHGSVPLTIGSHFSDIYYTIHNFRPGFGETIFTDLERPLKEVTIQTDNLGMQGDPKANSQLLGTLGTLLSMAFYVDPTLAAKYDASASKKKKKSPNSQDYEEIPTYPPYTSYQNPGGY